LFVPPGGRYRGVLRLQKDCDCWILWQKVTELEVVNLAPLSQIRGDESVGKIWYQLAKACNVGLTSFGIVGGPSAGRTDLLCLGITSVE
jgi:hypothetical protein